MLLFVTVTALLSSEEVVEWEIALPGMVVKTPIERKGKELILICEDRRLYSINVNDGTIRWKIKPGGRLRDLKLSPDGSIITRSDSTLYSIYGNGKIRWQLNIPDKLDSNIAINDRGDTLFCSNNSLYSVNRFGIITVLNDQFSRNEIRVTKNSLVVSYSDSTLFTHTFGGNFAWEYNLKENPDVISTTKDSVIVAYKNGDIEKISNDGHFIQEWKTGNRNPYQISENYIGDILVYGDRGITNIKDNKLSVLGIEEVYGLYYSNGLLIRSYDDWSLKAVKSSKDIIFYTSGKKQVLERTISLANKYVWGDSLKKDYYTERILDNNRMIQSRILSDLTTVIRDKDLLDKYPNFYNILLLASSSQNSNSDVRKEAYKVIGDSRDISFLPYLLSDLEGEKSYHVILYIYYALGQLAVDRTGEVVNVINMRIDDYHDESASINALYSLYNINKYSGGEFVEDVYIGIEKVLNAGYSKKIEEMCYDIINKLK